MIIFLIIGFGIWLYIWIDALLSSRRIDEIRLRPYNKWYIYLLVIVSVSIINANGIQYVKNNIIRAFYIPTGSMENTLLGGDFILVNMKNYDNQTPLNGDLIIFKFPPDPSIFRISRCIAVGGQSLEIRDKFVYVDGSRLGLPPDARNDYPVMVKGWSDPDIFYPEGYTMDNVFNRDNYGPITIPEDHLFVMGDNRGNSFDSRYWGFVPKELVLGKALFIYWARDKGRIGIEVK